MQMSTKNLREAFAAGQEIWVRNVVHTLPIAKGKPGVITIDLGPNAGVKAPTIPPGGAPICLSDIVPEEYLKKSVDLFGLINKGALELVDPKEAREFFARNPGQKNSVDIQVQAFMEAGAKAASEGMNIKVEPAIDITPRVRGIVEIITDAIRKGDKDGQKLIEADSLKQLINLESTLSNMDLEYLEASGKLPSIRLWAKNILSARIKASVAQ